MSLFDKLRRLVRPAPAGQPAPAQPSLQTPVFPWQNRTAAEEIAANCAIGSLRETLLAALKGERGVHAESLMVVIGAIAGYAAAHALWETMIKPGHLQLSRDIHVFKTAEGATYYFGDPLNALLIPERGSTLPLYSLIAGSAVEAGVPMAELPDYREIFRHIADVVGTPAFGVIRAPAEHPPAWTATQALATFWPITTQILSYPDNPGTYGHSVPVEHWPIVVNLVAAQFLTQATAVLDPRLAMRFIMEAAISTSKVDPQTVSATPPKQS